MLGYALNDQMSYENDLIGILVLIPILKNCFLRIVINTTTTINLQCVFVVLGKSNYNVANFSSAIRPDNNQLPVIDARINHRVTGGLQNIKLAIPEKGNRKADIFPDVFFLCLC